MKKGFTLLELIIVVIIIGVLAGLATPAYFRTVERARHGEGVQILGVLRGAQMRRYAERSSFTNNTSELDIDFTPSKFFNFTVLSGNYTDTTPIARVTRNNFQNPGYGAYNLSIQVGGNITCSGTAGVCARLGY